MAVLDTSFLIDVETGQPRAVALLDALRSEGAPLRVAAATWLEYLSTLAPFERSKAAASLEADVSFEALDRGLADEAARLQFELVRAGRGLSWHDLQIAATALHYDEALVTRDKAYARVPGLQVRHP